ncbi:AroM family protein [Brevibacillus sp. NRS-1366]
MEPLKGQVDLLLLDCMGYSEEARQLVSSLFGKPAMLSTALMTKLMSELI